MEQPTYIFVPLAMNQTLFYLNLAENFRAKGVCCEFISFHERSDDVIEARGFKVYSLFKWKRLLPFKELDKGDYIQWLKKLQIEDPSILIGHERVNFRIYDDSQLHEKFYLYLLTVDRIFQSIVRETPSPIVIQELGGFCSCLAVFFIARSYKIRNIFIEPSFFKGKVFFINDSLQALRVPQVPVQGPSPELRQYLQQTFQEKKIVIPIKDAHHFRGAWKKVLNVYSFTRLWQKCLDKYVLGLEEEFRYISVHVKRHLNCIWNDLCLRRFYSSLPQGEFIYFPLHVPGDMALTIRAPEYLDQISIVDYLARVVPWGLKVCIKEHPAQVGGLPSSDLRRLLRRYPHVYLLNPSINNYLVMRKARAVITINSKSGAEALLCGTRVLCLGDSFYRECEQVIKVQQLADLKKHLSRLDQMAGRVDAPVEEFFQGVWDQSYDGELYDNKIENVEAFCQSLERFLHQMSDARILSQVN